MTVEEYLPLVGSIGAPGLVVLFVILVLTGRLIPQAGMRERIEDKNQVIADLREANEILKLNNDLLRRGNETAVQISQATAQVVKGSEP